MGAPSIGVHRGIEAEDYFALDAINCSTLKKHEKSPAHVLFYMSQKSTDTPAMKYGRAAHKAVFEPDTFSKAFVVGPEGRAGTKKFEAAVLEIQEESPNAEVLKPAEMESIRMLQARVWDNELCRDLLSSQGASEVTVIAELDGNLCKGRLDRYTSYQGAGCIVDLKTCRDAQPFTFGRDMATFGYPVSASFYLALLDAIEPAERRFITIAAEKEGPGVTVIEYTDDQLFAGERRWRAWLERHVDCLEANVWPGYPVCINLAEVPMWWTDKIID